MTKNQLLRLLYYKDGTVTQKIISQVIEVILSQIAKGVFEQKKVEIRKFGNFLGVSRKAKTLKQPSTDKLIKVAPYKTMRFSYSVKALEKI